MSKSLEVPQPKVSVDLTLITRLHNQATVETLAIAGSSIDNDDEAADANEHLREWLTQLDKVSTVKKETLAPLKEAEKRINALFKPLLDAGADLTGRLRNMLTVYELEKRKVQRVALEAAAEAASSPEPEALLEALQDVQDAAPTALEGTSFTRVWVVKRIVRDLLSPEWLMPDEKKIAAYGKAHKGDDPPVIPGIVWEEQLSSRVRR